MSRQHTYLAIDLKSFYASVECQKRGLDPLHTHLVVADVTRSEKTICLAVSPSLKKYGISGRARLFEVEQSVRKINQKRRDAIGTEGFHAFSSDERELSRDPFLGLKYIAAMPHMQDYIDVSAAIYGIYLRYISADDIHVYSIDEVFIDATQYLSLYHMDGHQLARMLIQKVLEETGITATAGIGTNLYLAKVAMDIVAKHIPADKDGVRIAQLDPYTYRKKLWTHQPISDFWRVGRGIAKKLEGVGIETMGDVARCSIGKWNDRWNEDLLFSMFGVNAELLIDHAWGYESCTIRDIKQYHPKDDSLGIGQVLASAYDHDHGALILKEMTDQLSLKLVEKHLMTEKLALSVAFDSSCLENGNFHGETEADWYGRTVPKSAEGVVSLGTWTSSSSLMQKKILQLYEAKTNPSLLIRRISIAAIHTVDEQSAGSMIHAEQLNLFAKTEKSREMEEKRNMALEKEKKAEEAILSIQQKYGKNAVIKGMDLEEGATTISRNGQIGGHHA